MNRRGNRVSLVHASIQAERLTRSDDDNMHRPTTIPFSPNNDLPCVQMFLRGLRILAFVIMAFPALPALAAEKPTPDIEHALAAAERARALPQGKEYAEAAEASLRGTVFEILRDCMGHYPDWPWPRGFDSVLIIDQKGQLKWIICDERDPNTKCALKKLLKATFPPPPGDNWPVHFGFGVGRHTAPGSR